MNVLVDYQQIIISSTYERNGQEFAPGDKASASLPALLKKIRTDMTTFAEADQQLLESLLGMLDKEVEEETESLEKGESGGRQHVFAQREFDQTDYCAVCEQFICAIGLQCSRCYFTVHTACAENNTLACITHTSVRGSSSHTASSVEPVTASDVPPSFSDGAPLYEEGPVFDIYTRKGVLGKGGCGVVYKVVKKSTKEAFALKQMKKDSYLLDILEREIRIMKSFDHPGLTMLREAYHDEKFIYLVMDYIAGGELFDKIAELEHFSESDASDVTKQLLEALNYLHAQGCAHRDIKAENILLVSKEGTQVKIADFGLANLLGNRNKFMSFVGTTPYMAPEVLAGDSYSVAVDIWSLGVLVFVMLAGYMPFSGKTEMQEIRAILGGQYKFDLRRGWDKISASAKNFISNLLLQDPEARFSAAQALRHPWIRGQSLSGRTLESLPSLHNLKNFQRESKRGRDAKKDAPDTAEGSSSPAAPSVDIKKKKKKKKATKAADRNE